MSPRISRLGTTENRGVAGCAAIALQRGKLIAQRAKEMGVNRTTKFRLRLTRVGKRLLKRVGKADRLRLRILADVPGEGRVRRMVRVRGS